MQTFCFKGKTIASKQNTAAIFLRSNENLRNEGFLGMDGNGTGIFCRLLTSFRGKANLSPAHNNNANQ